MVTLVRSPAPPVHPVVPDPDQQRVIDHRGPVLRVVGGPGTGKSVTAAQLVAARVAAGRVHPDEVLLLSPTRRAADRLRDAVTAHVAGTSSGPLARTPHSFAFGVLRRYAAREGAEAPRLISGPEQDAILRELLAGYAAGAGPGPAWPAGLGEAVATRTFRGELRDLLMTAVELGLDGEDLRARGVAHDRPEWVAAADVLDDYDEITALASPGALDPAWLLGAAAARLAEDRALHAEVTGRLRLVVVDDAQELTPAAAELVRVLCSGAGPDLVLLGDPDAASQTFRGADPALMWSLWPAAPELLLTHGHRLGPQLQAVADRVGAHVGAVGGGRHRRLHPAPAPGRSEVHLFRTPAQEATWIADRLRRRHLRDGVPWSDMAVIMRGSAGMRSLARTLRSMGVPVTDRSSTPVRDHPAVRPLLVIAGGVLGDRAGAGSFTADEAVDLVLSPLGGADAVALRRLRRGLRAAELASGGGRPSGELLAGALVDPEMLVPLGPEAAPARNIARIVTAARDAARSPSATIETLLWAMWTASGLAPVWQQAALRGGPAGARADADLDAVVALFDAASRYVERLPGRAPEGFLEHLLAQELAADTLAPHAPDGESVTLLTPAEAAGRQWRIVCVAGVQEGQWPDLRLRGVLLGARDLADACAGRLADRRAARAAVLHDETRLLLVAVSRATDELVVSAVRSEEAQPSVYVDVVDPRPVASGPRPLTDAVRPLTLPGLVGELRRSLVDPAAPRRGAAATTLATLAAAGVPGADPRSWWSLREVSDDRPRLPSGALVRVSPSRLDRFEKCQLQWFLSACGGGGPTAESAVLGTLIHEIAHDLGDAPATTYAEAVRQRWRSLGLTDSWLSRRSLDTAITMTDRLARHVATARDEGWLRQASEVPIDVTVGRARIVGTVDRVETDGRARRRILDLKTGANKPTATEITRHRQLGTYQLAMAAGALGPGVESAGAALLQLGKAATATRVTLQAQGPLDLDEDPEWAASALAADAETMAGAIFTANPAGGLCSTCPVASSCPARSEGRQLL